MEAPDQVDEPEAGDPGSHRRVEGDGAQKVRRELAEGAVPEHGPRREDQEQPDLAQYTTKRKSVIRSWRIGRDCSSDCTKKVRGE